MLAYICDILPHMCVLPVRSNTSGIATEHVPKNNAFKQLRLCTSLYDFMTRNLLSGILYFCIQVSDLRLLLLNAANLVKTDIWKLWEQENVCTHMFVCVSRITSVLGGEKQDSQQASLPTNSSQPATGSQPASLPAGAPVSFSCCDSFWPLASLLFSTPASALLFRAPSPSAVLALAQAASAPLSCSDSLLSPPSWLLLCLLFGEPLLAGFFWVGRADSFSLPCFDSSMPLPSLLLLSPPPDSLFGAPPLAGFFVMAQAAFLVPLLTFACAFALLLQAPFLTFVLQAATCARYSPSFFWYSSAYVFLCSSGRSFHSLPAMVDTAVTGSPWRLHSS